MLAKLFTEKTVSFCWIIMRAAGCPATTGAGHSGSLRENLFHARRKLIPDAHAVLCSESDTRQSHSFLICADDDTNPNVTARLAWNDSAAPAGLGLFALQTQGIALGDYLSGLQPCESAFISVHQRLNPLRSDCIRSMLPFRKWRHYDGYTRRTAPLDPAKDCPSGDARKRLGSRFSAPGARRA